MLKLLLSQLKACKVVADKIYTSKEFNVQLKLQEVEIITPVKFKKDKSIRRQLIS
ncbi:hypothetical protein GXP67_19985 [Rhodocytophaga rosea]|uniref:Transposase n=1 Tax=Rhodocytophaga rosea TaxID=2704465 RepID=A0A6C0GLS4_9BACT|nr:hypothetical protein [Rhodocytophaga rosea]QHT68764.1 hypothetical protein GXP67_19985 [Rhodocytophaga rosea]